MRNAEPRSFCASAVNAADVLSEAMESEFLSEKETGAEFEQEKTVSS